jgi:GAF domain-containing protein
VAQRRQKASSKLRSRSPRQTVESLRLSLKQESEQCKQALERERATGEILRVIAESRTEIHSVFDTILASAIRLCKGNVAALWQFDGSKLRFAAGNRVSAEAVTYYKSRPLSLGPYNPTPQAALERRTVHVLDVFAEPGYRPLISTDVYTSGPHAPTVLAVPLVRDSTLLGVISIWRYKKRLFTEKQITTVNTFAAQAVIAIENTRLFNETKEALERQTATAEILKVIASSPSDTQPVFDAIARSAQQLFAANSGVVVRRVDDTLHLAAHTFTESGAGSLRRLFPVKLTGQAALGKAVLSGEPAWITDVETDPAYSEEFRKGARERGYRSLLAVPMLREGIAIGGIAVTRREPGTFSDHQVELLKTFADQAVIAIENVRLFKEVQNTNSTLREALEQQTATSEILNVISRSTTDVQPVFEAVARSAVTLCGGVIGCVFRYDGQNAHFAAHYGFSPEALEIMQRRFPRAPQGLIAGTLLENAVIVSPDVLSDSRSANPDLHRSLGVRSFLGVPMRLEGHPIGAISVWRREPGPFTDAQVALLRTFADQAVIAIENARLFNETKEALERQTATAEILKVISKSPSNIQPVFDAVAESAARLCDAGDVIIRRIEGGVMRAVAHIGSIPLPAEVAAMPVAPKSVAGRAVIERRTIHIHDVTEDSMRDEYPEAAFMAQRGTGYRTLLVVPLVRNDVAVGLIGVRREEKRPFSDQQIGLLQTFADQAVIAIENVHLFKELQERTEALTKSVGQLTALGEVGQAISSTLDLDTMLKTIVSHAVQLAGLDAGWIYEFDERDERFHLRAAEHVEEEILQVSRSPLRLGEGAVGRAGATREPVVVEDVLDESYQSRVRELLIKSGSRALLAVPLLREDLLLGALVVSRKSPGPFAPEVIDLLKTFATQSAVAIQNARLFNETKEALEQQKASADVLSVISSSIADTTPVFDEILDSCQRLFAGRNVGINVVGDDGKIHIGAYKGHGRAELQAYFPVPLSMESGSGAAILLRQVVHYPDSEAPDVPEYARRGVRFTGNKSLLFAPMLWEGKGVGAIFVGRPVTGPFSEKEIALLKTFADQAAIAIQNAKLFREIQEKSAQLEVASQHKSQFLASMSHELRTPLNAILGFNEMILDEVYGPVSVDVKSALEEMQGSGKHLLRLINNVLDLAKIEAGRMELALADYSVQDTVESVRSTLRPVAAEKKLELVTSLPTDLPLARGDAGRISQCLLNLAGNALKFTKEGKVEIGVTLDNGHLVYRVADTGIGIPADKIDSLFTEFKQSDPTIASEYGGTGLGLSITKKFIEMHGGRIWVESELGKGSTFTFEVPLRA